LKIKINNKEYTIKPTYGRFEQIFDSYDFNELENLSAKEQNAMILDSYWLFLKRRWYGFKPFFTRKNFSNNVTMYELRDLSEMLPKLLTGEDRNLKNSD
jgi:hypothetical protein